MELEHFADLRLEIGQSTNLYCPGCGRNLLKIEQGTVNFEAGRELEFLSADQVDFRFSALLRCVDEDCRFVVSVCGAGKTHQRYDDSPDGWGFYHTYHPKFFYPPIHIFKIPENCPRDVTDEIVMSFSSYFSDPMAAGSHMRVALEKLLNNLGVPNNRMSLHQRIELLGNDKELSMRLLAIKWLGNDACHFGSLTSGDVLSAYVILQSVLTELFVRRDREKGVAAKASMLTEKFSKKK